MASTDAQFHPHDSGTKLLTLSFEPAIPSQLQYHRNQGVFQIRRHHNPSEVKFERTNTGFDQSTTQC